jgi:hypothetical protein
VNAATPSKTSHEIVLIVGGDPPEIRCAFPTGRGVRGTLVTVAGAVIAVSLPTILTIAMPYPLK